jgi:hypothetical protein
MVTCTLALFSYSAFFKAVNFLRPGYLLLSRLYGCMDSPRT